MATRKILQCVPSIFHQNNVTFLPSVSNGLHVHRFSAATSKAIDQEKTEEESTRYNPIHIQMLSKSLHQQIFREKFGEVSNTESQEKKINKSIKHLKRHGLWGKQSTLLPEVDFQLPELYGDNIEDHFRVLAQQQSNTYLMLAESLAEAKLPTMPTEWIKEYGWTKYESNGSTMSVAYPEDRALVFDVEVCMTEGKLPTMAVAVSQNAWYSWCSEQITEDRFSWAQKIGLKDLIPLDQQQSDGEWLPGVVIGHNVSFDRALVKEQYLMKGPKTRYLDTMSFHMAISGLTSFQRILWNYHKKNKNVGNQDVKEHLKKSQQRLQGPLVHDWVEVSSPNNLGDVYSLYCDGLALDKTERKVFVTGSIQDIRHQFQELMSYCARDVKATHEVFSKILPMYFERFPNPVTFAAMLEMSQVYLPVNNNWQRYLNETQGTYEDLQKEMKLSLMHLANDSCELLHNDRYKKDPWLWELDWSSTELKMKKIKGKSKNGNNTQTDVGEVTNDGLSQKSQSMVSAVDMKDNEDDCNHALNFKEAPYGQSAESVRSSDEFEFDENSAYEEYAENSFLSTGNECDQTIESLPFNTQKRSYSQDASVSKPTFKTSELVAIARKRKREDEKRLEAENRINDILASKNLLYKRKQHMVGYPNWYRDLCPRFKVDSDWKPGPSLITSQVQVTPKLLRLTWDGFPLYRDDKHGWGYLVPGRQHNMSRDKQDATSQGDAESVDKKMVEFPIRSLRKLMKDIPKFSDSEKEDDLMTEDEILSKIEELGNGNGSNWDKAEISQKRLCRDSPSWHVGNGPHNDVDIPGCWFFKMPHKDGSHKKVGNPLAKDFLSKMEDGTLSSFGGVQANRILEISKMISFWRNAQDRISSQMVISLERSELPKTVTRHVEYDEDNNYGAILPKVVTAGTVTRRMVEPTWLTASNARPDRVGSELKAMVQAPPGYHFVGADVDSQELWIASLLGDARFAGFHGCTAFGWMNLQGNKLERTDLHSKTADTIDISRDQAKVFNYGRIYGAGQPFAVRLLMQFNHRMSVDEARRKASTMYSATKGIKKYKLKEDVREIVRKLLSKKKQSRWITNEELRTLRRRLKYTLEYQYVEDIESNIPLTDLLDYSFDLTEKREWKVGSESEMFNQLESIAMSDEPRTPVLGCRISRALEPMSVNNEFLTSRINWVVQSSAVDYLHLMLVCMRWLLDKYDIDGRFSISIHDEVRYLVNSNDKYRAAMALQISNLLTRCMFAYKLGMLDLPQSVAFFSAVDIDTVLRKEVSMDCKTPSNPHGLEKGYGIPEGEALDIYDVLKLTNNGSLEKPKIRK
uniref:DNA-directed DNA polymerase n=1 Tax=Saccoglossus kowalevskii TaxID=10224 RepID=A0ABM0M5V4_SACKO|nr:PREDICTED: DNA polymerase subunit gamma-1-like [Saccoglossus kowalevskii]